MLIYSPSRDFAETLAQTFRAVGCDTRICGIETAVWESLQAGPWDVFVHDADAQTPAPELYRKLHDVLPEARLWLLLPVGAPREAWEKKLGRARRQIEIFQRPFPPERLLQALQERGGAAPIEETHILLADTDPVFCEAMADFFSMEGDRCRTARSGAEAVAEARRQFFNVALIDVRLPDMSGWDLTLRLQEVNPALVVIVLGDVASMDTVLHALRTGAYDYLMKPLDPLALQRAIRKGLEKQKMALQIRALLEGLTKANGELVRLNELKNKFLRIVSHDLRTPLTAVKGYSQALKAKMIPESKYDKCFDTMVKECEHLEHLIGDLVDFVSIEAGKMRLEKAPLDPKALLEGVTERFRDLMEKRRIAYRVEGLAKPLPQVMADPRRLDQVLSNLIGNAAKHTEEGGSVTVRAARTPDGLLVEVRDTGEGIEPEHLARVFSQFFQVEASMSQRDGLGLGLAIAKEIVQRHGGEIGARSEGLGKGAVFWFTLPFIEDTK